MTWIVIIVLAFAGVLVSYFAGVRRGTTWGAGLLVLCTLVLVGGVIARIAVRSGRPGPRTGAGKAQQTNELAATRIGEGLRDYVESGTRIFILGNFFPTDETNLPEYLDLWKKGISKGLGDIEWTLVDYGQAGMGGMAGGSGFFEAVWDREGEFDVLVCMAGRLPPDLPNEVIYQFAETPVLAAWVGSLGSRAQGWVEADLIPVVVVGDSEDMKLITSE